MAQPRLPRRRGARHRAPAEGAGRSGPPPARGARRDRGGRGARVPGRRRGPCPYPAAPGSPRRAPAAGLERRAGPPAGPPRGGRPAAPAAPARLGGRLLGEARMAARLSQPNIIPIYAVDEAQDFVFYVMAYVNGETLAHRIATRGPLPATEAARILREVAWALAYAHAQGVVHRDVKPENILLEQGTGRALDRKSVV